MVFSRVAVKYETLYDVINVQRTHFRTMRSTNDLIINIQLRFYL